jgi:surfactin synthase thioesterase subunit
MTLPGPNRFLTELTDASRALIAFHHAGGDALLFRRWRVLLPPDLLLAPVQLPGRGRRFGEALLRDPHAIAAMIARELTIAAPPALFLFGFSMGALLAYELARLLELQGGPHPTALIVAAAPPAHRPPKHPLLSSLPDQAFSAYIRSLGGTPDNAFTDPEVSQIFLPILRADVSLLENYDRTRASVLSIPIHALAGEADQNVSAEDVVGWRELTARSFTVKTLPGDHFFVRSEESALIAHLTALIADS